MNPSNKLFKSKETQESSYPGDVIDNLRKKIHDLKESKDIANPAPVAVEVKSTKQDPPADLYDPQKRIQRLKDIFLEKTSKFRQAVCLLTGYKVSSLTSHFSSLDFFSKRFSSSRWICFQQTLMTLVIRLV